MNLYPKELVVLPQALSILLNFPQRLGWIFRGQISDKWNLLPKAGRAPFFESALPIRPDEPVGRKNPPRDLGRFNRWRELSAGYTRDLPDNDFECLAAAQHYGLPTRLLDFTKNALCALYFATESDFDEAGAVFAYLPRAYIDVKEASIYHFGAVAAFHVKPIDRRILAQDALFTFFPDPSVPLTPQTIQKKYRHKTYGDWDLVKFIVPPEGKLIIHQELADVGITRRTFFPDLDGLSRQFVMEYLHRDAVDSLDRKEASQNESSES